jgi:D-alanyl-D-alanine carboxypeptidase
VHRFILKHAAVVALMIVFAIPAARAHDRPPVHGLERELEALKEEYRVTALLFGLWRGDREILTTALGTSMTGVPATPEMHFRIGAVSIASLTTVLLRLAEKRVVRLDDTLATWFPEYPQSESVTLQMLANSSSGYRDYVTNESFIERFYDDVFAPWRTDELIALGMEGGPLYPPGTGWNYAHTNFLLLGEVLGEATGKPVGELVTEHVIERLGLEQTVYITTPELPAPVLHAFTTERGPFEESTFWNPSWTSHTGGLNADLHDLGQLFRALATGELLSRRSYDRFTAPTTAGLGPNTPQHYYGLGIEIDRPWIVQSFSFGGYGGKVGYLPRRRLTMAVVTTLGEEADPEVSPAGPIFETLKPLVERR